MASVDLPKAEAREFGFARLISTGIAGKILIDTGVQLFNPFLQIIAQGIGIDIITLGRLLGVRSAMGLFAPLFGAIADLRGYRRILQLGLVMNAIGLVLIGVSTSGWVLFCGMVLSGLGMSSFTPTLHAYLSHRLPYSIRARGLGMIEYSWALTGIFGLFLMGLLIQAVSWRAPFFVLAVGLLVMALVYGTLPSARTGVVQVEGPAEPRSLGAIVRQLAAFLHLGSNQLSAYATMAAGALIFFAGMQFMLMYGTWLGSQYGLTAAQLGLVALVFGLFDLTASVSVSLFADRIGKRRSVFLGSAGALIGYLLMPFFNIGLFAAIAAIGTTRGLFEFAIVSNFPLLSEQVPEQRGKVMTLGAAIGLLGATLASFTAPPLFTTYDVAGIAITSATASALGLLVIGLLVQERDETDTGELDDAELDDAELGEMEIAEPPIRED